jgi:hypothetical protein
MTILNTYENAWEVLLNNHKIQEQIEKNYCYYITTEEISEFIEPNFIFKFDHKSELPSVFTRNNLSILPISNNKFIIGRFQLFERVNYKILNPNPVSLIEPLYNTNEIELNSAYSMAEMGFISGMYHHLLDLPLSFEIQPIKTDIIEIKDFDFTLHIQESNSLPIKVRGPILENFYVYETINEILLVLSTDKKIGDFNIAHMFYPYKLLKINSNKEIKPVLLTRDGELFSLFLYQFKEDSDLNSIQLIKQQDFFIDTHNILFSDVEKLAYSTVSREEEPNLPFPQADTFENIIILMKHLLIGNLHKDKVPVILEFTTARQTDYYTNAAIYLGLIEKKVVPGEGIFFSLSERGRKIMSLTDKEKFFYIIQSIFEHSVFKRAFLEWIENGSIQRDRVVEIMIEENLNITSNSTLYRRSKTIIGWIDWILNKIKA